VDLDDLGDLPLVQACDDTILLWVHESQAWQSAFGDRTSEEITRERQELISQRNRHVNQSRRVLNVPKKWSRHQTHDRSSDDEDADIPSSDPPPRRKKGVKSKPEIAPSDADDNAEAHSDSPPPRRKRQAKSKAIIVLSGDDDTNAPSNLPPPKRKKQVASNVPDDVSPLPRKEKSKSNAARVAPGDEVDTDAHSDVPPPPITKKRPHSHRTDKLPEGGDSDAPEPTRKKKRTDRHRANKPHDDVVVPPVPNPPSVHHSTPPPIRSTKGKQVREPTDDSSHINESDSSYSTSPVPPAKRIPVRKQKPKDTSSPRASGSKSHEKSKPVINQVKKKKKNI
jgi:hypothetical protein